LAASYLPLGRFFATAGWADRDCLVFFAAAAEEAGFFSDFFIEPPKILSQPSENFSVEPVWTVYPVIVDSPAVSTEKRQRREPPAF
jgi:hypothetical protein